MGTAAETLTQGNNSTPPPNGGNGGLPEIPPAAGWWDSLKDPEVKTWAANKKYPDAESALKAHWGLERLMGAEKAGRTVMLPKDENDADGWKALASKLGVPEKSDDYKLPMPEGVDDGFAKTASKWFHEAGVPPRAASKIAEAWNGWVTEQVKAGETAERAESERQMHSLASEWGKEFDAKRELAQRGFRSFAKQFGLDDKAALERAESVLGAANLTRFFSGLGTLDGESGFAGNDARGGFGMNAADAQKRVNEIIADRASGKINDMQWRKEYEPEMQKLAKILSAA